MSDPKPGGLSWIPKNLSLLGAIAMGTAFVAFTGLIVNEFYHGRRPTWDLIALWGFSAWALTGLNPGSWFRSRNGE